MRKVIEMQNSLLCPAIDEIEFDLKSIIKTSTSETKMVNSSKIKMVDISDNGEMRFNHLMIFGMK